METPQDFPIPEKKIQTKKKKRSKNVIRFTDHQIKSLESIFKTENKIEPRKKLQLATDLGLQPRQVAIWFQNRRARWKSKQIEQDYNVLKAKYYSLYVRFDDLNKEKQSLQIQLNELKDQMKNLDTDRDVVSKQNPESSTMDQKDSVYGDGDDDDDEEKIINCSGKTEEEKELLNWCEEDEIISYIAAPPQTTWSSASLFRQSSGTSDWWENV